MNILSSLTNSCLPQSSEGVAEPTYTEEQRAIDYLNWLAELEIERLEGEAEEAAEAAAWAAAETAELETAQSAIEQPK